MGTIPNRVCFFSVFFWVPIFVHRQFFPTESFHLRKTLTFEAKNVSCCHLPSATPAHFDWKIWLLSWIYDRSIPHARVYGFFTYINKVETWPHEQGEMALGKKYSHPMEHLGMCATFYCLSVLFLNHEGLKVIF